MPRTPDRDAGPRDEEELRFPNNETAFTGDCAIARIGDVLKGKDPTYGTVDLLAGGSGMTVPEHDAVDALVHNLDEDGYVEATYTGDNITNITVWTDSEKTKKIREYQMTFDANDILTAAVEMQYDSSGVEKERLAHGSFAYTDEEYQHHTMTETDS